MKYPSQRIIPFEIDISHPLMSGLVYASLGNRYGSNLAEDSSIYSNHGTLNGTNGSEWINSVTIIRPILRFDKAGSKYVRIGTSPSFYDPDSMAVAFWMSPFSVDYTAHGNLCYAIAQWEYAATKRTWGVTIRQSDPGTITWVISTDGGNTVGTNYFLVHGTTPITAGWQHFAFNIRGRRYLDIYKDGAFQETLDPGYQFADLGSHLEYGSIVGVNDRNINGYMSDVMMWSGRLLSTDEIAILSDSKTSDLGGLLQIPNRWLYAPGALSSVINWQERQGRRTGIGAGFGARR